MKFRHKLVMMLFAWMAIIFSASGMVLATAITEQTTITLGMLWVILSAFVTAMLGVIVGIWKLAGYVRGVNDKMGVISKAASESTEANKKTERRLTEINGSMIKAHEMAEAAVIEAEAANRVAVGGNLEARFAQKEANTALKMLPCQIGKQPKKCLAKRLDK